MLRIDLAAYRFNLPIKINALTHISQKTISWPCDFDFCNAILSRVQKGEQRRMHTYNVCMNTPLGVRMGNLRVSSLTGVLDGTLHLLGKVTPVSGEADQYGSCHLNGDIITLVQTIPFTAKGKLTPHAVSLLLHTDWGEFELNGTAAPEKAECEEP